MMNIIETSLPGVIIIEPAIHSDSRGWFMESWSDAKMRDAGLEYNFVQDNHSFSAQKGVLRGIHFQQEPYSQVKLVRCTSGAVLDVTVDLRRGSPTYKSWAAVELSADNKRQLLIPKGFGHAFLALTDNVEFLYKVDCPYNSAADRSIRYNDPELAIGWTMASPLLSGKDVTAPLLKDSDCNYIWEGFK